MTSQELSDIVREWVKADEHRTILFYASNGKEYTTDVLINNKGEFTSYLIDLAKKSEDVRKEIKTLVTETLENPLYQDQISEILLKAASDKSSKKSGDDSSSSQSEPSQ